MQKNIPNWTVLVLLYPYLKKLLQAAVAADVMFVYMVKFMAEIYAYAYVCDFSNCGNQPVYFSDQAFWTLVAISIALGIARAIGFLTKGFNLHSLIRKPLVGLLSGLMSRFFNVLEFVHNTAVANVFFTTAGGALDGSLPLLTAQIFKWVISGIFGLYLTMATRERKNRSSTFFYKEIEQEKKRAQFNHALIYNMVGIAMLSIVIETLVGSYKANIIDSALFGLGLSLALLPVLIAMLSALLRGLYKTAQTIGSICSKEGYWGVTVFFDSDEDRPSWRGQQARYAPSVHYVDFGDEGGMPLDYDLQLPRIVDPRY